MTIRVVGAGLGRTGTASLKQALERLLGAPCYHMLEVNVDSGHVGAWHAAANGDLPHWDDLLKGYVAAVDWPASAFWEELAAAYPDALILLSERDPQAWWKSASGTIFPSIRLATGEWREMMDAVFANRFTLDLDDRDACIAAYRRHVDDVLQRAPPGRLLRWRAGEGWEPICTALGLPVPDEPFPHTNTTEDFLAWRDRES